MLEHLIPALQEQQKLDGAVDHPEFNPDDNVSGWPLLADPKERMKLEKFVLSKCISDRHKFKKADGAQGVVYFDGRGRAVSCAITDIPDADLVRLAREGGKRIKGQMDSTKPRTGKNDHGYVPPVTEETEELFEGAGDPISIGIGKQMAIGRKQGVVERKKYTDPDDLKERIHELGEEAGAEFSAASRSAKVLEHYGWTDATSYSVLGVDKRTMMAVKDLEKELAAGFYKLGQIMGLRGREKK